MIPSIWNKQNINSKFPDHYYSTINDAYPLIPRTPTGYSDHIMLQLIATYMYKRESKVMGKKSFNSFSRSKCKKLNIPVITFPHSPFARQHIYCIVQIASAFLQSFVPNLLPALLCSWQILHFSPSFDVNHYFFLFAGSLLSSDALILFSQLHQLD